jgi:hypothetical protein
MSEPLSSPPVYHVSESWRDAMIRIQFVNEQDRIRGNYLLATNSIVRRLRGQVFEIAERDRKLLDDHQLPYTLVTFLTRPADDEVRNTLTVEL